MWHNGSQLREVRPTFLIQLKKVEAIATRSEKNCANILPKWATSTISSSSSSLLAVDATTLTAKKEKR